jgi:Ala-tRNA(Pro) deacylase
MYALDYLRSRGVWYEPLLHRPASSSTKRAGCVHVPGRRVAKAVLVRAGESFVLAVLPSTARIDLVRLSGVVGEAVSRVRLATLDELCEVFPDCEPGVVPAFGQLYGLKTLVDSALADSTEIVMGANTRHEGVRMLFSDFQRLEQPVAASFARLLAPEFEERKAARRERKRRAG